MLGFGLSKAFPYGAGTWAVANSSFVLLGILCLFLSLLTAALLLGWSAFGMDRDESLAPFSTQIAQEMVALIQSLDEAQQAMAEIAATRRMPGHNESGAQARLQESCGRCRGAGIAIHACIRPLDSDAADLILRVALLPVHIQTSLRDGNQDRAVISERLMQSISSRLTELIRRLAYEEPIEDVMAGLRQRCGQAAEILTVTPPKSGM